MTAASKGREPVVDTPVVEMNGVTRSFPGEPPVVAIREVDLRISRGEHVSIVGPSGSGKSTLLHMIGLLDVPTAGSYRLGGIETGSATERERARIRCVTIGFVFQAFHLMPYRNVLDNVLVGVAYSDVPRRGRRADALDVLDRVGLSHRREAVPTTLSGGERQRVAIARALLGAPSLLLADEPTGNLDSASASVVLDLFDELHADGITIAVITHDRSVSDRAQRVVRIVDGHLEEM